MARPAGGPHPGADEVSDLYEALRKAVAAVNAPGVELSPWKVEASPGGDDTARKNSAGILGGCVIEHAHAGDDEESACVMTEFAVVWNNDSRLPATHKENASQLATARAIVAAVNLLTKHGSELLEWQAKP